MANNDITVSDQNISHYTSNYTSQAFHFILIDSHNLCPKVLTADAFDGLTAADIDLSNNRIPTFPAAAFSTQNLNSM